MDKTARDGLTSQDRSTTLVSGTECGYGGIQYDSGPDTNNDGELQPDEITATQYVCNGAGIQVHFTSDVYPP